jgi:hypothetical protein
MLEDRKMVRLFTIHGGNFGVLTRMPLDEIRREVFDEDTEPKGNWIKLEGLTEGDERVEFCLQRDHLSAAMLSKFHPGRIARPEVIMQ